MSFVQILTSPKARIAVLACCAVLFAAPSLAFGIEREVVLARAEAWVARNVPYSQSRWATVAGDLIPSSTPGYQSLGYRTDCSGFVSMALRVQNSYGGPTSLDTATLPYRCTEITGTPEMTAEARLAYQKSQLMPGDIMLKPKTSTYGGHVVIFVRWANAEKTKYVGYHESGTGTGTISAVIPYPYYNADKRFRPFRYNQITDGRMRRSRTWIGSTQTAVAERPIFGTASSATSLVTPDASRQGTVTPAP
ncbi:MAG TPA: hypothetical protein VFG89_10830 [Coriobacteriia bacterium]|nr:hypothetical protein [Coriobacteriia bacterium]